MKNQLKNQTLNTLKKFKFTNVAPAIFCRQQIASFIQSYDQDQDKLLNNKETANLLSQGLKVPKSQISTVLKEVYQYDNSKNNKLTFQNMSDFITNYYFDDIMTKETTISYISKKDFVNTLQKTVKLFNTKISLEEYQTIFNDIDQKRAGHITREQYRQFIRDYFGSESHAAAVVSFGKYKFEDNSQKDSLVQCQRKIARLIFSQLKVAFMKYDFTRSLSLTTQEAKVLMAQIFGLLIQQQEQLLHKKFNGAEKISYENLMKQVVLFYLCQIFFRGENKDLQIIKAGVFVELIHKALYFVRVKPSMHDLQCIFSKATKQQSGLLTRAEYIEVIKGIFARYQFPIKNK